MSCTTYNDSVSYDAVIAYNGVCISPTPVIIPNYGGTYAYPIRRKKKKTPEEDEVIVAMLLELMDDN